jgi:DNA processing protein
MLTLGSPQFPSSLIHIPNPPKHLYAAGAELAGLMGRPRLAVVGSRRITPYGRQVTAELSGRLAERGVVIISGLAFGVDKTAHLAALDAGGCTVAVLPGPLESVAPASHRYLARRILEQGGALVTEYPPGAEVFKQNFIARNRIVAGLADAVLITEAAEKSGSLHTARFALEQGKDVLVVPGNITSDRSQGANRLLRAGATPVTCYEDVLLALGLETAGEAGRAVKGSTDEEQSIIALMQAGVTDGEALLYRSGLSAPVFNGTLTMLEISGKVRPLGGNRWSL